MAVEWICDGCQKRQPGSEDGGKPWSWYQRRDADGWQTACSRECIEIVSKATGKTGVVAPF